MNNCIVITGGAGFIGSHVVRLFVNKYPDCKVICVDSLTYAGSLDSIKDVLECANFEFVQMDICDFEAVKELFAREGVSGVIHLAAESHVDRSISDPFVFAKTNVLGTLSLLQAAKEYWQSLPEGFEGKKFHHVSTDEVYGALEMDESMFTEESKYMPHSPYSASKASSDHFVRAFHDTYGLPTVITNCSNNYGPAQYPEKLIPLFIKNIVERKALPVYGKGQNVRDWLYVGDHARAIDMVFHSGAAGRSYNVGGNNEWKNIDLVKLLIETVDRQLGRPAGADLDLITYVTDRAGHDLRYAIDSSRIREELGWAPEMSFETGIEETVKWYLNNNK